LRKNVEPVSVFASTGSSKWTVTLDAVARPVAPSAGVTLTTDGAVVSAPVVSKTTSTQ
jgi:hypothetical protein